MMALPLIHCPTALCAASIRLLLSAVLVTVLTSACTPKVDPAELLARAEAALVANDIRAAELDVKAALAESPADPAARLLLGQIYLIQGDPVAAQGEFERANRGSAADAAQIWLGKAMLEAGSADELLEEWRGGAFTAVESTPEFQAVLARALLIGGDQEAARDAF